MPRVQERLIVRASAVFGREEELKTLERCLADAGRPGSPKQVAFVSGRAGVGKVRLVERAFSREACWYGYAKFTQEEHGTPHAELSSSLAQIAAQLGPHREQVATALRAVLTVDDAEELADFCPAVGALQIYPPRAAARGYVRAVLAHYYSGRGGEFALERLKYVVKLFFRAVSTVRPVVWVFDDLQYATKDGTSLPFIRTILADSELTRFVFCGIVREGRIPGGGSLDDWIEAHHLDVDSRAVCLTVTNMSLANVRDMLADLLQSHDVDDLASLMYQRTNGNDFFLLQLIDLLQEEGLLTFSTRTYRWEWDIDEIKRKSMVSDNVLALVGRRLLRLPTAVQRCLQLAAHLGYRFDEDLLAKVIRAGFVQQHQDMKDNLLSLEDILQMGVDENFIERIELPNVVRYKFVHVEIQSACQRHFEDKIDTAEVEKLHWNIGAALWRGWRHRGTYEGVENRMIFPCVKEVNSGMDAFNLRETTRYQLIQLNYEAAKRSCVLRAFFPAATYLQTAVGLLDPSSWEERYDLSLELHTFLAQMCLASGQLGPIPRIAEEVRKNASCFDDLLPVEIVAVTRLKMQGKIEEHIRKCVALLNRLGVRLRARGYFRFEAEKRKRKLKEAFDSMSNVDIRRKSEACGTRDATVLMLEQELLGSLLFLRDDPRKKGKSHPNLAIVTACEMVTVFVQEESRPGYIPVCLALAASLFCAETTDGSLVRRFYKTLTCSHETSDMVLSIRLAEAAMALPNNETDPQTIATVGLIRHWRYPLANCTETTLKGYDTGMKSGNLSFAFQSAWEYILFYLFSGLPLDFLVRDCESILTVMIDYSQKFEAMRVFAVYQFLLNMNGQSENVLDLKRGKAVDHRATLGWEPPPETASGLDLAMNLYIHCQEFGLATKAYEKLHKMDMGLLRIGAVFHVRTYNFALICIHNAKRKVFSLKNWKKRALKYVSMVEKWVEEFKAINMYHRLLLLKAELFTLKKPYPSDEVLIDAYDEVIVRSARSGFLQDSALAASLGARAVSNKCERLQYAFRSQEMYTSWDAAGVVKHLQSRLKMHKEAGTSNPSDFATNISSGLGVRGRQRFRDEDGILQVHRSITAAEDKARKDCIQMHA